ncbi:MAG: hypothetical protein HBSIN02_13040 [Bacteroidia bacterium]|nr:MAG: hypothetical protein HBSIN02_13040 [Bacteroidia bacterium]
MIIRGGTIVSFQSPLQADIEVMGETLRCIRRDIPRKSGEQMIDADGCYVFPALVNSHDHLEFNLYPRLGSPPYRNAYEWGRDLHARSPDIIRSIERIPLALRSWWGAWKNLFSGVTVVVHHGRLGFLQKRSLPVSVPSQMSIAHSLEFEDDIEHSIRKRRRGRPFVLHVAEGTDETARREIRVLKELGGLDRDTVIVHAVGAANGDAGELHASGAAVVWCPSSNLYLFGATAPVHTYLPNVRIALGTDSTLTGVPTLFEELRIAHGSSSLPKELIAKMVTVLPKQIFGLPTGTGELQEGGSADFFLVRQTRNDPVDQLFSLEPEDILLLVRRGKPLFWDSGFRGVSFESSGSARLRMRGTVKVIPDRKFSGRFKLLRHSLKHYPYLQGLES